MKRFLFLTAVAVISVAKAISQPSLSSYLNNDLELQRLALEVKKSELSNQKTSIENGLDVTLSTGTASFKFNGSDTSVSFTPSAKVAVPQASNLSIQASSRIKIENGSDNTADTSISLGVDLISGTALNRKITLMKAERSLLEARRALQNRALEAEKEYYSELKSLYTTASSITSLQKDMYKDTIDFESVKAKGYATSSAKYRQAEMKVVSDKHEVEKKIHSLEHDCAVFASKCGKDFTPGTKPEDFLPETIGHSEPVFISSFNKEDFTKIENARYKQQLAELQRRADKDFSLTATAGYTFKNSNTSFDSTEKKSDTLDAGLNATYKGLTLGAGINVPTDGSNPTYTASATVKPNTFRTASIKEKTNSYNIEEEEIAIKSAEDDYETALVDKQSELNDLAWSKKTNSETYELYSKLTDDMKILYDQGLVKETEYLDAYANKQAYHFKMLINDIELIIYNNSTKLLFCRDAEIQESK